MPESFSIVGAGRVGTYLSVGLMEAGHTPVSIFSSDGKSAAVLADGLSGLAEFAGKKTLSVKTGDATFDPGIPVGSVVIVAVADASITAADIALARRLTSNPHVILHTSGALSGDVLVRLSAAGHAVGSMHPLQTFDQKSAAEISTDIFTSLPVAIEGDPRAVDVATLLAESLGARPFVIDSRKKVSYHIAAVLSSNFYSPLLATANDLLPAGLSADILAPLARQAVENAFKRFSDPEAAASMTGPVARGDVDVIRSHLELLRNDHPEILPLYAVLSATTANKAYSEGLLSEKQHTEITSLLDEYDRSSRNQ